MTDFRNPVPQFILVLERDGVETRVGEGGDLAWSDVRALGLQHPDIGTLPAELVKAVVSVMRVFPGAMIVGIER